MTTAERRLLEKLAYSRIAAYQQVIRARIVLDAARGYSNAEISRRRGEAHSDLVGVFSGSFDSLVASVVGAPLPVVGVIGGCAGVAMSDAASGSGVLGTAEGYAIGAAGSLVVTGALLLFAAALG